MVMVVGKWAARRLEGVVEMLKGFVPLPGRGAQGAEPYPLDMLTAGARGELVANRLHIPEPSERVIVDPQGREGPGMTAGRSKRHLERRDRLRCSPQAGVDNPEVQGRQTHRERKPRSPLEWRGGLLPPPPAR